MQQRQPGPPRDQPRPTTFILPGRAWEIMLPAIVKDARPGDVIEVHSEEMRGIAEAALQAQGRQDVSVVLRSPPGRRTDRAA